MSAPVTNGVLHTKLSDMKIGDYIKWYYRNFTTGVVGELSQTGLEDGTDEIELPSSISLVCTDKSGLGDGKNGGYFYFLKVQNGILIADRAVQVGVSAQAINGKNYFKGNTLRLLTTSEYKNVSSNTLNDTVEPGKAFCFLAGDPYHQPATINQELNLIDRTGYTADSFTSTSSYKTLDSNNTRYGTSLAFVPVMEYVDNSKSTNIYY